jgi:putative DNA primase/helicase
MHIVAKFDRRPHRELFRNRWRGILPHFGLNPELLNRQNGPCPFCGGRDRFRFTDYQGDGYWICNQCGPGDGFEFVKRAMDVDFREAIKLIEPIVAGVKEAKLMVKSVEDNSKILKSILRATEPVTRGSPVWTYLERRLGPLRAISGHLKYHPDLPYIYENGNLCVHPAMIALVTTVDGATCNLHRTYLTRDGHKANVPQPKKVCVGPLPKGCAIRLTPVFDSLGIAEGIETALAATELTGIPCWAAVSSHGLETWEVPETVKIVTIFGDNDPNYAGQGAAYALARRLSTYSRRLIFVNAEIPREIGDWCDVLKKMRTENAA